jgi:hypothetical protein
MDEKRHVNRLIHETSPYLRQHAHNPVDWYPWGDEAFERARREDKPILLSIGYSACHWCHVMERESFEDEEIARLMNEHFVNIKVDREERPDVDAIYMSVVQAMTGHGGWPLTVFLTPEGIPFYGGTYFPPVDRHGLPAFPRVLRAVADAYRTRRGEIEKAGRELLAHVRAMNTWTPSEHALTPDILDSAYRALIEQFDATHGGFGRAPKFPAPTVLEFLLRMYLRTGDDFARKMVEHTLVRMARGGIYDQVGGGFHRYAVDAQWLIPHFEKMLYDNALLAHTYLVAYQITGDAFYREIVEETLDYVLREMTDPHGGFYAAQDADSEGEEGKFYVWTPAEIRAVLGEREGEIVCRYFGVTEWGNFEGKNVLSVPRDPEVIARLEGLTVSELMALIRRARQALRAHREHRTKPLRDEKILVAWNGLMLRSFARAALVLNRDEYYQAARRNAEFLLTALRRDGGLWHTFAHGVAKIPAYQDDYACLIEGVLALYETDFDPRWFREALALTEAMLERFWDAEHGGFFYTSAEHSDVLVRVKEALDTATPSGNAVAAEIFLRLYHLTGDAAYWERAQAVLRLFADPMRRHPYGFGRMLCALDLALAPAQEIALVGDPEAPETRALRRHLAARYLPHAVVAFRRFGDEEAPRLIPLLRHREPLRDPEGRPVPCTVYVCENFVCHQPVTRIEELEHWLPPKVPATRA